MGKNKAKNSDAINKYGSKTNKACVNDIHDWNKKKNRQSRVRIMQNA